MSKLTDSTYSKSTGNLLHLFATSLSVPKKLEQEILHPASKFYKPQEKPVAPISYNLIPYESDVFSMCEEIELKMKNLKRTAHALKYYLDQND